MMWSKKLMRLVAGSAIVLMLPSCSNWENIPVDPSEKDILTFTIPNQVGSTIIDEAASPNPTIEIMVPFGTALSSLTPTITHTGSSISPETGVAQNFTNSVRYTVTAVDLSTKVYVVTVTSASASKFVFSIATSPMSGIFALPLTATGVYDFTVDWGDETSNSITAYDDPNATHVYASAGTYTISMSGIATEFDFSANPTSANKVRHVDSFADLLFTVLNFQGCTQLESIADNMNELTHLTTAETMFAVCGSLVEIPAGSFDGSTGITSFYGTFAECTSLTSIPSGLFDKNSLVTTFDSTFYGCSGLTSIPSGLFDENTLVTTFRATFDDCSGLTSIPSGLFDKNTAVSSFMETFYGCTGLTSIPSGLFDENIVVSTFKDTFNGCTGLTSIPSGSFDNNTLVTSFNGTFAYCSDLTSIPSGLFDENTTVTNFEATFNGCNGLTSIPSGLFNKNTAVVTFKNTFNGCTSLTSIPSGLFDKNALVTTFENTFSFCTNLEVIPSELFRHNSIAINFRETFSDCNKAQLVIDIFYPAWESATRFLDQSVDFTNCFNRNSYTGAAGTAPDLWNADFGTGTPITGGAYGGPGNGPSSLVNYADVPAWWK